MKINSVLLILTLIAAGTIFFATISFDLRVTQLERRVEELEDELSQRHVVDVFRVIE